MSILTFYSRKWLLTTLLAVLGVGVLIRLGIWQLDRLEQRKTFNYRVLAQQNLPALRLNRYTQVNLDRMEYRQVVVRGKYDFSQQVALRNQVWMDHNGVHLITPLLIEGIDQVILVDRGWIPAEEYMLGDWGKYDEPGIVEVNGVIRLSMTKADFGRISDPMPAPGERLTAWNLVNIPQITNQMPYHLMPVYIQQAPEPSWEGMPYRGEPYLELTEGPHLGYALQWFTIASIHAFGYPIFIWREEHRKNIRVNEAEINAKAIHQSVY